VGYFPVRHIEALIHKFLKFIIPLQIGHLFRNDPFDGILDTVVEKRRLGGSIKVAVVIYGFIEYLNSIVRR